MYKIAICDDDKNYRETIKEVIEKENVIEKRELQFYDYDTGEALLREVGILHDLIFIDIRMPGIDGNKTARLLRMNNENAVLVFCSAFFETSPESINIGRPFRYIMKDLHDMLLKKQMSAILLETAARKKKSYLITTANSKVIRLPIDELAYISVAKRGSNLYFYKQGKIEVIRCRESIMEMYGQLEKGGFEYAHNSYIVNLAKVVSLDKTVLCLEGGIQLNVSRSKKAYFEERFMRFLKEGK